MKWHKLGRIFDIEEISRSAEMLSHASTPSPLVIGDNQVRIFYSSRDIRNRSSISYFDLDLSTLKIIYAHDKPLFKFGEDHTFFSEGISLGNVFKWKGAVYMAFMGWKIPEGEHWFGQIGLLGINSENNIHLLQDFPVLPINSIDPISLSYPWVSATENMEITYWYGSTLTWDGPNCDMIHVLKEGRTINLSRWESGTRTLAFDQSEFQAFSSPTILEISDKRVLFFSYRGEGMSYKIGSAELTNEYPVATKDDFGISENLEQWESEMQCYPRIFQLSGKHYMLYNGNQYGKSGIGLALLVI